MQHRRFVVVGFLFSMALLNYVDRATISFAAGPIAHAYHLDTVDLGYLFSAFLWTYTLFVIPAGALVARYGARVTAASGLALWSCATAATGLATGFSSLILSRLVMGGGESVSNPAGAQVVRDWIPAAERGLVTSMFNSGSYAGPALCALAAGPVLDLLGWRALFFLTAGIGFVWLAAWLAFYDGPERVRWIGDAERARILAARGRPSAGSRSPAGVWALLRSGPTLWGLALTQGCNVYAQYLFLTWLPTYLHTVDGISPSRTGLYASIPYAAATVACVLIGYCSDRILGGRVADGGRRRAVAATLLLAAVVLLAPLVSNIWLILAVAAVSLAGIASTTSLNFALVNDLVRDPRDVGTSMAVVVLGGNLFGLAAPIVTGYLVTFTGRYDSAFLVAGVLLVLGSVAVMTLTRRPIAPPAEARLTRRAAATP